MKQGLFKVFGCNGQLGLKAGDLNQYGGLITEIGLSIPEGMVITTEVFDRVTEELGELNLKPTKFVDRLIEKIMESNLKSKEAEEYVCPNFLLIINEEILTGMEINKPYAIRSSTLSENGGIGIYKSKFFWVSGNKTKDLETLWRCELEVYASEFTRDAELWRKKIKAPIGMAILIQPIVGSSHDQYFFPDLAGTAFTSYRGLPTVRVVVGLGTLAVSGDGCVYHEHPKNGTRLYQDLSTQAFADALTAVETYDQMNPIQTEVLSKVAFDNFELFKSLFIKLDELSEHGNFYLEWAISDGKIQVVQISSYEDKIPDYENFDATDYKLLLSGDDLVAGNDYLYSGRASCEGIIHIREWSPEVADVLEYLNENMKDYLLVIPPEASSLVSSLQLGGKKLSFKHFSNALTVAEKQVVYTNEQRLSMLSVGTLTANHANGTGAMHFSSLCDRADILFIGGNFNISSLYDLPGMFDCSANRNIGICKIKTEVIVDKAKGLGQVYVPKQKKEIKYSFSEVKIWAETLRQQANGLYDSGNKTMANYFYNVAYTIIPDKDPLNFDPYKGDESLLKNDNFLTLTLDSFEAIIMLGDKFINDYTWEKLKEYLTEFLLKLKEKSGK